MDDSQAGETRDCTAPNVPRAGTATGDDHGRRKGPVSAAPTAGRVSSNRHRCRTNPWTDLLVGMNLMRRRLILIKREFCGTIKLEFWGTIKL